MEYIGFSSFCLLFCVLFPQFLLKCFKSKQESRSRNRLSDSKAARENVMKIEEKVRTPIFEWEAQLDKTQIDSAEAKVLDESISLKNKKDDERKAVRTALELKIKRNRSSDKRKHDSKTHKKECQVALSTRRLVWRERGGEQKFYMTNKGKEYQAVKICCANNLYGVRPVFSCIEPGRTAEFLIKRKEGAINKDKIVVCTAPCSIEEKDALKSFFKHVRSLSTQNIVMVVEK